MMSDTDSESSSEEEFPKPQILDDGPPFKRRKFVRTDFPGFTLLERGSDASLEHIVKPLALKDVLSVIEHKHLGEDNCPSVPWWINTLSLTAKQFVIILRNGKLPKADDKNFPKCINQNLPCALAAFHSVNLTTDICLTALLISCTTRLISAYESIHKAAAQIKNASNSLHGVFNIVNNTTETDSAPSDEVIPRQMIAMDLQDMLENNYPLPLTWPNCVNLHEQYVNPSPNSPLFGIDIEGGMTPSRVSVCTENGGKHYDSCVTDCGYTEQQLLKRFNKDNDQENLLQVVKTPKSLHQIQEDLKAHIPPDAYLVGHDLRQDLRGLQILFPHIIDTSRIYNINRERDRRQTLGELCEQYVPDVVPNHIPLVDARAAVRLVKQKLINGYDYGNLHYTSSGRSVPPARQTSFIGTNDELLLYQNEIKSILKTDESTLNINYVQMLDKELVYESIDPEDFLSVVNLGSITTETLNKAIFNIWAIVPDNTAIFLLNIDDSERWDSINIGIKVKEQPEMKEPKEKIMEPINIPKSSETNSRNSEVQPSPSTIDLEEPSDSPATSSNADQAANNDQAAADNQAATDDQVANNDPQKTEDNHNGSENISEKTRDIRKWKCSIS